jgi:aspartate carbamoyltransferase catalytic subunit
LEQLIPGIKAGNHVLSVKQFDHDDLERLFEVTERMIRESVSGTCKGKIMTALFYEPSSRTFASFIAAMERLGGSVIPIQNVSYSSVAKGETLEDTVRTFERYSDVIVMRHPEIGSARKAAHVLSKPLINAGDGAGEHPTQALLDLFTIREELGELDGLTVTLLGDLKYGRTVHSLAKVLAHFNVDLNYVSPDTLRMPEEVVNELAGEGIGQNETVNLGEVLSETDVLYVTRIQKERFEDLDEYEEVKDAYVITPEVMKHAKERMIVMHPLPRVGEISARFDHDPRAAYFRQMEYGMYVRMALLALVLGKL